MYWCRARASPANSASNSSYRSDEAGVIYETLIGRGRDFGLKPYGVLAMFTLGLEKAYPAHGLDMDERRTPFHIGLDRFIKFDKGDFIGREALLRVRDDGVTQHWAGLVAEGGTPAEQDALVYAGDETIGPVTYSDHGYSLGRTLATAHLAIAHTKVGTALTIDIGGNVLRRRLRACRSSTRKACGSTPDRTKALGIRYC